MSKSSLNLSNVIHAPNIQKNIVSVSKLVDDVNASVEFTPSSVYVKDLRTRETFAEGKRRGNIYIFQEDPSFSLFILPDSSLKPHQHLSFVPSKYVFAISECNKPTLWHSRLGHCGRHFIEKLVLNNFIPRSSLSPKVSDTKCPNCHLCKSRVLPFNSINKRASMPFEVICSDVRGPASIASVSDSKYTVFSLIAIHAILGYFL